jgi:hypothetical protein
MRTRGQAASSQVSTGQRLRGSMLDLLNRQTQMVTIIGAQCRLSQFAKQAPHHQTPAASIIERAYQLTLPHAASMSWRHESCVFQVPMCREKKHCMRRIISMGYLDPFHAATGACQIQTAVPTMLQTERLTNAKHKETSSLLTLSTLFLTSDTSSSHDIPKNVCMCHFRPYTAREPIHIRVCLLTKCILQPFSLLSYFRVRCLDAVQ